MSNLNEAEKKKVGIISIHYGVNFGSSLQAYALSHFIENRYHYSVEIINYIPPRYRYSRLFAFSRNDSLKGIFHKIIRYTRFYIVNMNYKKFLSKLSDVSPEIYSIEDASLRYKDYNYLLAGSDQIWNSDYNEGVDSMYYLSFASQNTKKIAYAASIGKTDFTQQEWSLQAQMLETFYQISYREDFMVDLMESHGIRNGQLVLDPTFLLKPDEWKKLELKPKGCPNKYLLIYLLDTDSIEFIQCAIEIAKQKELETVLICNGRKNRYKNINYTAANLTPNYYIWLFKHAEYIVTNSFHGVAFSINMEQQFSAIKRDKYNGRLDSILKIMGLTERYITIDNISSAFKKIDYEMVNKKKQIMIEKSVMFLDNALT